MSIQLLIENYKHICDQIQRHKQQMAELQGRKHSLEQEIEHLLAQLNAPGIVVDGTEVSIEKRVRKHRLGMKKRQAEITRILEAHSISNVQSLVEELSKMGPTHEQTFVKVKNK